MRFEQAFLEQFHPETAKLILRADRMTDANAEETARTHAWIKATDHAYANQEWVAYLSSLFFAMWSMQCCGSKFLKRLLQYSNDFIRFGKEHFEEALANAGRYMNWTNRAYVNCYGYVYEFYCQYHQISDEKIDELLQLYYHEFRAHPGSNTEYHYMFTQMQRSMELRDKKQTAACLRRVLALQKSTSSCYVCHNREIAGALLLLGRTDEALHRIVQIISDEGLPEWWYNDFANCENANAAEQYNSLLLQAFWLRMPEMLHRLAREFKTEILCDGDEDVGWNADFIVLAINRDPQTQRAAYLEEFTLTYDTVHELTPKTQLLFWLSSWSYFEMLHQCGIDTVQLSLLKPPTEEQGDTYNTHEFAEYFLKKADALGAKFDRARPSFQYEDLRKTARSVLDPAYAGITGFD